MNNNIPNRSCSLTMCEAFHAIHVDVGAAFQWQLEKRGPLPEVEYVRIGETVEKATTLVNRLHDIPALHDLPSRELSWLAACDILERAGGVLHLSHRGQKETLAAWYALKAATIDRDLTTGRRSWWDELYAFPEEIDHCLGWNK